jgi:hypothetical protein
MGRSMARSSTFLVALALLPSCLGLVLRKTPSMTSAEKNRDSRRDFAKNIFAAGFAAAISKPAEASADAYTLPPLPYDYSALEPAIGTPTMKLHHDKHHQVRRCKKAQEEMREELAFSLL